MEVGIAHPVFIGLIAAGLAIVAFLLAFLGKQIFNDPKKKAEDDKALLKELLEGFGLDIPVELQEAEGNVIKPMKNS